MQCQSCGSEDQSGNFCAQCGAALNTACASCGAAAVPGARYCTACGEPLAGRRRRRPHVAWVVAGGALLLLVLVLLVPRDTERAGPPRMTAPDAAAPGASPGIGSPGAAGAGAAGVQLSGDMRANADRLFNRIMAAAGEGDRAEVERFMPMAIQAYGMVEDLDHDGLYHLAILQLTGGRLAQARQTASRILDDAPQHLLALGVAAAAAAEAGDVDRARALYRRLLDAYEVEASRPLPEYVDHAPILPEYRQAAEDYLREG